MSYLKVVRSPSVQDPRSLSFEQWLVSLVRRVNKKAVGSGTMATFAVTLYGGFFKHLRTSETGWLLSVTSGVQLLVVFFLVVLTRFTFVDRFPPQSVKGRGGVLQDEAGMCAARERGNPIELGPAEDAARTMRHYRNYCLVIWLCWLALYLVFTIKYAPGVSTNQNLDAALTVITTLLNNCATLAFLYCYLTLRQPDTPGDRGSQGDIQTDWPLWGGTLIMLTGVEVLCVALAASETFPGWFTTDPAAVSTAFGWISGVSSATVLALHTSCLTDNSLCCPTWVVVLLFAYAGLQTGFVALGNDNTWVTFFLLNFALLLKALLYLYLTWAFRYGWLMRYFRTRRDEKLYIST